MVGCLMKANQAWARNAGALVLSVLRTSFAYNQKPNRVALHDLGQAAAHLALQATAEGLQVHQMGGVELSKIRDEYSIPDGFEPQTGIAIGYPDANEPTDDGAATLRDREEGARKRKSLGDQVFAGQWNAAAKLLN
jgi:nitroreductase